MTLSLGGLRPEPGQAFPGVEWQEFRLQGQEWLAERASKKLKNDGLLITSMAGKRQGFLMCIFILLAGLCVRGVNPIRTVLRLFGVVEPFARSRLMSILAIIFGVLFVLAYVGTMGALRTGAGKFAIGFSGITLYMEVPLINFEYQCGLIGFGPYIFSIPDLLLSQHPISR